MKLWDRIFKIVSLLKLWTYLIPSFLYFDISTSLSLKSESGDDCNVMHYECLIQLWLCVSGVSTVRGWGWAGPEQSAWGWRGGVGCVWRWVCTLWSVCGEGVARYTVGCCSSWCTRNPHDPENRKADTLLRRSDTWCRTHTPSGKTHLRETTLHNYYTRYCILHTRVLNLIKKRTEDWTEDDQHLDVTCHLGT